MTREEQNKILEDKIESNVNQYKVDRLNVEISAFSSGDLNRYEFLKRIDLNYKPNALDKARFEFSPLGTAFNEGLDKTIPNYQEKGVIKLLKEIIDNLAGGINIPAGLVIPPGPPTPGPPPHPSPPTPTSPSPTNITTPTPPSPSPTNITTPTTESPPPTNITTPTTQSPSSSLTNVTPLGSRRSRIPRPSISQSDIDLNKLLDNLEYIDMINKLKSRKQFDIDLNKLFGELKSQESVYTPSIPAQDDEPVPLPKLKPISKNFTFKGYDDLRQGSRKDRYDDKNKEPSKIPKPSKSLKPQGIRAGEWAKYAIELNNTKTEKIIIEYLESKLRDMDLSSKEASETINQIQKMKNMIPKLEQELSEYYEDLIRRDREYRMSRK